MIHQIIVQIDLLTAAIKFKIVIPYKLIYFSLRNLKKINASNVILDAFYQTFQVLYKKIIPYFSLMSILIKLFLLNFQIIFIYIKKN